MVRLSSRVAVTLLVVVAVLVGAGAHGYAEPTPAQLEQQIDEEWNKLEPIIEQYNLVHNQLKENQAKVDTLGRQLQPLQLQVDNAMARVSDLAVRAYKLGPGSTFNALLSGDSPTALLDQLGMLNEIAHTRRQQISGVETARDKYAADKRFSTIWSRTSPSRTPIWPRRRPRSSASWPTCRSSGPRPTAAVARPAR